MHQSDSFLIHNAIFFNSLLVPFYKEQLNIVSPNKGNKTDKFYASIVKKFFFTPCTLFLCSNNLKKGEGKKIELQRKVFSPSGRSQQRRED